MQDLPSSYWTRCLFDITMTLILAVTSKILFCWKSVFIVHLQPFCADNWQQYLLLWDFSNFNRYFFVFINMKKKTLTNTRLFFLCSVFLLRMSPSDCVKLFPLASNIPPGCRCALGQNGLAGLSVSSSWWGGRVSQHSLFRCVYWPLLGEEGDTGAQHFRNVNVTEST